MVPFKKPMAKIKTKTKARRRRVRRAPAPGHAMRPNPGIQISLRLQPEILAKLIRLSQTAFQTKSQFIAQLVNELSEAA